MKSLVARLRPPVVALLLTLPAIGIAAEGVTLQWYGQSATRLTAPDGRVIVIDPFILNNPVTPDRERDLERLGDVDLILVTHAHGDHFGDTVELAETTDAPVGVNADFGSTLGALGVLPGDRLIRFNKSGPIEPIGDGITVTMVRAEHSSDFVHENDNGVTSVHPGGEPVGFIIEFANGYTVYHMGDTGVFADLEWIGEYYEPDLALVPIGGHFTMDPKHAAFAMNELLEPEAALPIHYGTFPPLKGTPEQFAEALGDTEVELIRMAPGDRRTFD
jgi:L-ascorbate metabolism protein UlaG (beta-lactamase superfamily)